jgi:peptide/nickel transport system substrate-binding protein
VQQIVKQNWEALGTQVTLKSVDAGVFFSDDKANPDTAAHFFTDVEMFTNGAAQPDDFSIPRGWTCAEIKTAPDYNGNNYERYCDKDYDALVGQLATELDPAKRADLYKKINDKLINDVVLIPLVARNFPVAGRSVNLKGVNPDGWDGDLWNVVDWTNQ